MSRVVFDEVMSADVPRNPSWERLTDWFDSLEDEAIDTSPVAPRWREAEDVSMVAPAFDQVDPRAIGRWLAARRLEQMKTLELSAIPALPRCLPSEYRGPHRENPEPKREPVLPECLKKAQKDGTSLRDRVWSRRVERLLLDGEITSWEAAQLQNGQRLGRKQS